MSVNISRRQLVEPGFVNEVRAAMQAAAEAGGRLILEVTESAVTENPALIMERLRQLRALGVELHMDDFGTGQSTLSRLPEFPFHALKIDRSFVACIGRHRNFTAILHAVIALAHNLEMKIVAEGIETPEQLAQLIALDCDFVQGYLFSRSVDLEGARQLIARKQAFVLPSPALPPPEAPA